MSDKHKQAQRVKNNARPSSSVRSLKFLLEFEPEDFLTPCNDIDPHIDPIFQVVLKKLTKKDPTTRLKGLQSFAELVAKSEDEVVNTILPNWAQLYCVLATDSYPKVREATQIAHNEVVLKSKRNLAPYLKQIAGAWYTLQHDIHAPAATATTKAFKNAFSINKVQEAIIFIQEEILNYIYDNLAPQMQGNPKALSASEIKTRYVHAVVSSLQGYASLLRQVPSDAIRKVIDLHKRIITDDKFWKLAHCKAALLRGPWYGVIAAICEKAKFLLDDQIPNVIEAVFLNLDQTDPTVQLNLWEAILLITNSIDEWWKYCNIKEELLPKLFKVLREGGHGNASVIYPNLLPLLSHMPTTLNDEQFLLEFFDNMKIGLQQTNVRASKSESRVIAVSLIECLKYSIIKNYEHEELCTKLVKGTLIDVLDIYIVDQKLAHKTFFNQISMLMQYWHKNRAEFPNYEKYLATFWKECDKMFSVRTSEYAAKESEEMTSDLCARQIELLVALKHTVKTKQVKFITQEDSCKSSERRNSRTQFNLDRSYLDSLLRFVYNCCILYIKILGYDIEKKLPKMIDNIVALVQDFESVDLVEHLKREFDQGQEPIALVLIKWIKSEEPCCRGVVDMLFFFIKYTDDEELTYILDNLLEISNQEARCWCISSALSHPHKNRKVIQKWLGNKLNGDFIVRIIEHEIAGTSTPDFRILLKQVFTETSDEDLLIGQAAVDEIVEHLQKCLYEPFNYPLTINNSASLAAYIASSIYTDSERQCNYSDSLFRGLLVFNCTIYNADDHDFLSSDTLWEVKTAWHDALVCIAAKHTNEKWKSLIIFCANLFEMAILDTDVEEKPIDIICQFLLAVQKSKPMIVDTIAREFFEISIGADWRTKLFRLSRYADYMNGTICFPTYVDLDVPEIADEDIEKYFMRKSVVMQILNCEIADMDRDGHSNTNRLFKLLSDIELIVLELLQDNVILDNIVSNFPHLKCHSHLKELTSKFMQTFGLLVLSLEPSIKSSFENALNNNVKDQSCSWAVPARTYYKTVNRNIKDVRKELINDMDYPSRMQFNQVFIDRSISISDEHIEDEVSDLEALVIARLSYTSLNERSYVDKIQRQNMQLKTYDIDFNSWEQTQMVIEILRFCRTVLEHADFDMISRKQWDFIVVSLGSWSEKLAQAKFLQAKPQIASFIIEFCNLFIKVRDCIPRFQEGDDSKKEFADEWNHIFLESIMTDLMQMWLYLGEHFRHGKILKLEDQFLVQNIGNVIRKFEGQCIFNGRIDGMPNWSKLLKQSCLLLTSPIQTLQLWGYYMMIILSQGLIQMDQIAIDTNTLHEKGLIIEQFKDVLDETHNIVSTMLLDFKLGEDRCEIEPFTDSYTYTFAYLLLWDFLMYICENASTELRIKYSDWLKKEDLLNGVLSNLLKMMPFGLMGRRRFSDLVIRERVVEWFNDRSDLLIFNAHRTSETIHRLNCTVYISLVAQLPVALRQWWSSTDSKTSQIVENIISTYVSPTLRRMELKKVADCAYPFKNLKVTVHQYQKEVRAVYTVDDCQINLSITLPKNYPLGGPDVQCDQQIGSLPHKQWIMQFRMCVMHQYGKLLDALLILNNNLDKKFEGVEECYICFGVLHPGTHQLPKLSCKTCRKKFHSACLYKWFSTSNKSTCPICRNLF